MKVTIRWEETNTYTSPVEIDDDEMLGWINAGQEIHGLPLLTLDELTAEHVQEFLESTRDDETEERWWNPDRDYDAEGDWDSTVSRDLLDVESIDG